MVFDSVGVFLSVYKEKFGTPRQSGLVSQAQGKIVLTDKFANADYISGIESFSHLWVLFYFNQSESIPSKRMARPPRLGGNKKVGVFASRTNFRPNNIGMSVVKLERVTINKDSIEINVTGADIIDQTPILDIKPYIPYADIIDDAAGGYASERPTPVLQINDKTIGKVFSLSDSLRRMIHNVISLDPRPAYRRDRVDEKIYGMTIGEYEVKWKVEGEEAILLSIEPVYQ